jgi:replication initiation protein RepC
MQTHGVTTPFGRRGVSLALVKGQMQAEDIRAGKVVDKWKLFRDVAEAREKLGLQDRSLAVLNALLSFYPETDLCQEKGLVVFPSNEQLSLRAHGIAGTTLRRHLAALVDAGLLHRRDSPNGKRYVRRQAGGEIEQAFGFSLAPLLLRSEEFAHLAQSVAAERRALSQAREALTICRRDIRKLITAAIEEGASGNWDVVESHYIALVARLPRRADLVSLTAILEDMQMLRDEVLNILEMQLKSRKTDANAIHSGYHIQNSKPESFNELEPALEKKQGEKPNDGQTRQAGSTGEGWAKGPASETDAANDGVSGSGSGSGSAAAPAGRHDGQLREKLAERLKPLPLPMVLKACPQILDYGPDGDIRSWRDLLVAAVVTRSMLGVSPSAYQNACEILGAENAAIVMACILERAGQINSAGGYLRDLTRKAERGEFSLAPMVMALMRQNGGNERKTG